MKHVSAEPFHPGVYVREMLADRGWSRDELARKAGCDMSRIIDGTANVTADDAKRLAAAFGTSAQLWLNLQAQYEIAVAPHGAIQ